MAGKRVALCALLAAMSALQLFAGSVSDSPQVDGGLLSDVDAGGPRPLAWVPVQNLSLQVRVPPGKAFYVYFDQGTETLKAQRLPDEAAGLPPEAVAAAQRAPDWIRPDLTRMFARLSEVPIDPTTGNDYTSPAFADVNGDGALDLVLGDATGRLTLYENVDPALHYSEGDDVYVNAVFVEDAAFFPASVQPVGGYGHPAVGDLNGDNLPDLVLGGGDGRVYVFDNAGPAGSPAWVAMGAVASVSAGSASAPALADLDGDGDLDLIVGSGSGLLYAVVNEGANPRAISDGDPATVTTPAWASARTLSLGIPSCSSPALADVNGDGRAEMAVGDDAGRIRFFRSDGTNWVEDASVYTGVSPGARAAPALADLDADGLTDLAVGTAAGLLRFYPNVGSADRPRHLVWTSYSTGFNYINFDRYYAEANSVALTHREATPRLLQYAAILRNAPQRMVDEIAFSIAKSNAASLLNPLTFPDVYLNNTDSLYFNAQFTPYAEIVDYDLGMPDQWSTVRYRMNESGTLVWYEYPREVYYWWLVEPKGTDELATFIDPTVVASGHEGARDRSNGGMFWRWAAFNLASPAWPRDPGARGYPKEEAPPVLRDKIGNATVLWNNETYTMGSLYNGTGWFVRDAGGNVTRPWNATDQAVEIVDHWVASTVPMNAQDARDPNRPRQPVRIQWEHNGNCGEISDMLWAALRAALIPARGICGYGGDHCWGEFYERGWHQIDDYWDASISIIANNDNYHYGWNRDWSGLMAIRGDGFGVDVVDAYHHPWNASNDAAYPPESRGLLDRANVTVTVTDAAGNRLDGVKVAVGDYRYLGSWTSFGTQWTFTDADGMAYLSTSEARQNWASDPNAGDPFDDGIAIFAIGKLGEGSLGAVYDERLKPSYGDAYNPRNAPMHYYTIALAGVHPRPALPATPAALPPGGVYALNVSYRVVSAAQHPAAAAAWNEGLAYHDLDLGTGLRVMSFLASESEFRRFQGWSPFRAAELQRNVTGGSVFAEIPSGEDWYFVLANPGTLETAQVVDLTAQLLRPPLEQRSIDITPAMLGRRLMSLPIHPVDTGTEAVLRSVAGSFDHVRWYDPSNPGNPWRSYVPGKPHNTLTRLDETMGFWINFTRPCTLVVTGYPVAGLTQPLRSGWNLVGFPFNASAYTVGNLTADVGVAGVRVEAFDPAAPPYNLWRPPPSYALREWEGYWVYTPQECLWVVRAP